jgi:hypothetical protein
MLVFHPFCEALIARSCDSSLTMLLTMMTMYLDLIYYWSAWLMQLQMQVMREFHL